MVGFDGRHAFLAGCGAQQMASGFLQNFDCKKEDILVVIHDQYFDVFFISGMDFR
jgi:hypothetical protein